MDENINEEDDVRFDVDGLPVVMESSMAALVDQIRIEVSPEQGIVVIKD